MAILPETDTYYGTEVFAIFNINRQQLNATVSVEDVFYGEEFTVNFTIQGSTTFLPNEYYYFEYKPADAADSAYTTTRPTATGNYVVRLTVLPNGYTEDGVATGTFAIKKLTTTATVTVADIYVGGTVAPVAESWQSEGEGAAQLCPGGQPRPFRRARHLRPGADERRRLRARPGERRDPRARQAQGRGGLLLPAGAGGGRTGESRAREEENDEEAGELVGGW